MQGVRTPLKNHKNIRFLSNIDLDLLKNCNSAKPTFNVGPVKRFTGGPMMARLKWYFDPLSLHQVKNKNKRCQSWTPSDETFWIRVCLDTGMHFFSV